MRASANQLDLDLPNARVYVGPCIAGHVGADTAGAILAEGPHRSDRMQLLVDVGTNAEIVLGDRSRQWAASSPTGPAFEGAQISSGQRATAGAIEGVRIDPLTLEPRLKVIGIDVWSEDPVFADKARRTGITGICGSGIIDVVAEMFLAGIIDQDGVVQGALAERTSRVVPDGRTFSYVLWGEGDSTIAVTQNDIRAIQLAKAALRAGIDLLVEHAGNPGHRHPPGRRLRRPHRPTPRDDPGPRARLPDRRRAGGRQCRRHRSCAGVALAANCAPRWSEPPPRS